MRYTEEIVKKNAAEAYVNGDVKFPINYYDCALLVIDMQDEFVKPEWTPYWVPNTTKQIINIEALIRACSRKKVPVIYTVIKETNNCLDKPLTSEIMPNNYTHLGYDESWFKKGSIVNELDFLDNKIVIYKVSYGAFYNTSLETILRNLERNTIIICGTSSSYNCGVTARQGFERGFNVIFGSDITSTDNPEIHDNELKVLRKGFAKVMTSEEIIMAIEKN